MGFKRYITRRKITPDPIGDFARDARADSSFPLTKTWEELEEYLDMLHVPERGRAAAKRAWDEWSALDKRGAVH